MPSSRLWVFLTLALLATMSARAPAGPEAPAQLVGVAKEDITPTYPIRLCGYAVRSRESEGVEQHLWAKALAIGADPQGPALLVTVDNCAVPGSLIEQLAERLKKDAGIARERLVVCSSHTHSGPCLSGAIANMFGKPLPPDQQATIDRYTHEFLDSLEKVCLAALADRKPARLAWGQGEAGFAANRRTPGGPVEHVMPMLAVTALDGKLRAIVVDYACHGTTLGGEFNRVCGDWIGYAQQYIEANHPGAVALVMLGCAGDANPSPRGTLQMTRDHGREIATEVERLLKAPLTPLNETPEISFTQIEVAFDPLRSKQQWEELAKRNDAVGGNARLQLARLNSGQPLPTTLPYPIETWTFGDQLAMVFLAGEVVVDYDLRLKHDFDPKRLWVAAYSNDVPCYIPSKRILNEGGYEAEDSLTYYGRPARLSPGTENDILRAVMRLLPTSFRSRQSLNEYPLPKSPQQSLAAWRTRDDMKIELVASEPLVQSPIAIDWGADGRLWVLEMIDYPNGLHENMVPGGRVKVLESTRHDGHYDKATVFLDGLTRPTGLLVWGDGVLVCAAPDILYARDTHGAGHADVVTKLFTGFGPENEQWLVNGLSIGLDNWIYGASSISNGPIHVTANGATIDLGNRDFRFRPETRAFEPASGRTQYCRVRDDWGNWFGNDNSNLLWHYPLPEQYVRRNPEMTAPPSQVLVPGGYDVNQLYPASRILERFNNPGDAGRTTSACGPTIYRDDLMGPEFTGNAFICEPVHDLVMRLVLTPEGVTFHGRRSADNERSEFLASTDNWSRPVQARTGPDGALWVVDMYRFVIEHPRWISPDRLAMLDIRAGADMGRIYRIFPKDKAPRAVPRIASEKSAKLAKLLDNPNGTLRDMIQRELVRRQDRGAAGVLEEMAQRAKVAAARVQAIWVLDALGALRSAVIHLALADPAAEVRRNALRLSETRLSSDPALADAAGRLVNDPEITVRYQLALSLGEWNNAKAAEVLAKLAADAMRDEYFRAAIVSSATHCAVPLLARVLATVPDGPRRTELIAQLCATAGAVADARQVGELLQSISPSKGKTASGWQFVALSNVLDVLASRGISLASLSQSADAAIREATARCLGTIASARQVAGDPESNESLRAAALALLGRDPEIRDDDLRVLAPLLGAQSPESIQQAALEALSRGSGARNADAMLGNWSRSSPALRAAILQKLLSRPQWIAALLDAVEKQKVRPAEIPAPARARLLADENAQVRERAASLLAASTTSNRRQVLEQFKPALTLKGDFSRGRATFAKTCAACHVLEGQGHSVGADLTALTDRGPQALMIDILDPNAAVDGRFVTYVVQLRDGRTLSGIIANETASGLTVVQPNDIRDKLLRRDIERIRATGLSLMPEGLEAGMSAQDLADLITYVADASRQHNTTAAK